MTTSQKYVFTFYTDDPDPESIVYGCTAATLEEAERMVRAAGYREFTLYEQRALEPHETTGAANARILDNPFLGPEWLPLVETIELLTRKLRMGQFWVLDTYGAAYGHDPYRSPYVQAMHESDGSLHLEVSGRNTEASPLSLQQHGELEFLGWDAPIPADFDPNDTDAAERAHNATPNSHRIFAPGWNARAVAEFFLETLTVVFEITEKDLFNFGENLQQDVERLGVLSQIDDGPIFYLTRPELPEAAGASDASARPVPDAPDAPDDGADTLINSFGPQSEEIELVLTRARSLSLGQAWLIRAAWSSHSDSSWRTCLSAARSAAQRSGLDVVKPLQHQVARALDEARARDELKTGRGVRWGPASYAVRGAVTALLARDLIDEDGFTQIMYDYLTRIWRGGLGKIHPDDAERLEPWHGPQALEVEALLAQVTALQFTGNVEFSGRGSALLDAASAAAESAAVRCGRVPAVDDAMIEVSRRASGEPIRQAAEHSLLALLLRGQIADEGFTQAHYDTLTQAWRQSVGSIHPDDLEIHVSTSTNPPKEGRVHAPVGKYGPQTTEVEAFLQYMSAMEFNPHTPFGDEPKAGFRAARDAVLAALANTGLSDAWDAATDEIARYAWGDYIRNAAQRAVASLMARDQIAVEGFTQAHYDTLTLSWREYIRPIHPDDASIGHPERKYGPQTAALESLLMRARDLTEAERSLLAEQAEHRAAEVELVSDFMFDWEPSTEPEWREKRKRRELLRFFELKLKDSEQAVVDAMRALVVRDFIGERGFTQARYDLLTQSWRQVIGKVHPDDADIRPLHLDRSSSPESAARPPAELLEELTNALGVIAQWQLARNAGAEPLLEAALDDDDVPEAVERARDVLLGLTANDWLTDQIRLSTLAATLQSHLIELDDRELEILRARILSDQPVTLDALGGTFGVTRERIRQLEVLLRNRIAEWMATGTELDLHARAIRQRIGGLNRLDRLVRQLPGLAEQVDAVVLPAWFVIDKFDDAFESDGVWVAEPSLAAVRTEFTQQLTLATSEHGVLSAFDVDSVAESWSSLTPADSGEWLAELGFEPIGEHWFAPRLRSIQDRAAAFLSIEGEPRLDTEIQAGIAPDRALGSIKNALKVDPRLARVDRKSWALTEWNLREYGGLRKEMERRVLENGPIPLEELVAELTEAFAISASSIETYAYSWPFDVIRGHVVLTDKPPVPRRTLTKTKHLYKHGDHWAYRVIVTEDHLRGSGFPIPVALAVELDLQAGGVRTLKCDVGTVVAAWRAQPHLGSIREQVQDLGCKAGDQVMIRGRDGSVSFTRITPLPLEQERAVRALVGFLGGRSLSLSHLAAAVALPAGATWADIRGVFDGRGEQDIVYLLDEAEMFWGLELSSSREMPSSPSAGWQTNPNG